MADTEIIFDLRVDATEVDSALNSLEGKLEDTLHKTEELKTSFDHVKDAIKSEKTPLEEINGLLHRELDRNKENKGEVKELIAYNKDLKDQMKLAYEQAEKMFDKIKEEKEETKELFEQEKEFREEEKLGYEQAEKMFDKMKEQKDEIKEQNEVLRLQKEDLKDDKGLTEQIFDKNKLIKDELKEQKGEAKELLSFEDRIKSVNGLIFDKMKEQKGESKEILAFEERIKAVNGLIYDKFKEQNERLKLQKQEVDFNERAFKTVFGHTTDINKGIEGAWKGTHTWSVESEIAASKIGLLYTGFKDIKELNTWGEMITAIDTVKSRFTTLDTKIEATRDVFTILKNKGKEGLGELVDSIGISREKFEELKEKGITTASSIASHFHEAFEKIRFGAGFITGVGSRLSGLAGRIGGIFTRLGVGATMATAVGGVAINKMVDQQSRYTEALNATGQIFGKNTTKMVDWANKHTATTGQSKAELMEGNAQLGAMLKGMGMNQEKTAEYSKQMTQMGADLGSFFNKSNEDVSASIKSIITGETETMKDNFGIVMTQQNLQAFARQEHYKKDYKAMSQQEQLELRLAYVRKSSSSAMGDYSRSLSTSLENQKKLVMANIDNVAQQAGKALLPLGLALTQTMQDVMPYFTIMAKGMADMVVNTVDWFKKSKDGQQIIKDLKGVVDTLWQNGSKIMQTIGGTVKDIIGYVAEVMKKTKDWFTKTDEGKQTIKNLGIAFHAVGDVIKVVTGVVGELLKGVGIIFNTITNGLTGATVESNKYNGLVDAMNEKKRHTKALMEQLKTDEAHLNKLKKDGNTHTEEYRTVLAKVKEDKKELKKAQDDENTAIQVTKKYHEENRKEIEKGIQAIKDSKNQQDIMKKSIDDSTNSFSKMWGELGKSVEKSTAIKGILQGIKWLGGEIVGFFIDIGTLFGAFLAGVVQLADIIWNSLLAGIDRIKRSLGELSRLPNNLLGGLMHMFGGGGDNKPNKHANGGELATGDIWGETNQAELMVQRGNQGNGEVMNLSQIQSAIERGMRNVSGSQNQNGGHQQPINVYLDGEVVFRKTLKDYSNKYGSW